jgi:hypothetical protein
LESFREAEKIERDRAQRLDAYAPFNEDGYWKKAIGIAGTLGLLSATLSGFQEWIGNLPWMLVGVLAVGVIVFLFGVELFIDWLRNRRLTTIEERFPERLYELWENKALGSYRRVLYQFLLLAIRIREEFYPNLKTIGELNVFERYPIPHINCGVQEEHNSQGSLDELEERLAAIVEQHFAFKPKE